jgi:hypothetical protein
MMIKPEAPLFRDPLFDGAADPVIIWNRQESQWWIMYTNRRATAPGIGVSWAHGTDIGIASSPDGSRWLYRGTARGLEFENGRNSFWAPEVIWHEGIYHMYCSYVRGIPTDWNRGRDIVHYTSTNLWDWQMQSIIALSSGRVIDACVFEMEKGLWKMWYKDEEHECHTFAAESRDLSTWKVIGPEISDCAHEGPNVFVFEGKKWMITDPWEGLGVYSSSDFVHWNRRKNILYEGGNRPEDGRMANHADVLVHKDHAYIFYFVHPEMPNPNAQQDQNLYQEYRFRRSSLQVAELKIEGEDLVCDRDNVLLDLN